MALGESCLILGVKLIVISLEASWVIKSLIDSCREENPSWEALNVALSLRVLLTGT